MNNIAILYICTGVYDVFWNEFYESFEHNFLLKSKKHYFVFTDSEKLLNNKKQDNITFIMQENLGWPGNTLFRFKIFSTILTKLEQFDYVYFMNANVICVDKITEEEFLPPTDKELVVVQHPGFFGLPNYKYPYDRNKKSTAYVPYSEGDIYICGGINGGKTKAYLNLIVELSNRIEEDYKKNIIAKWHDESQINRYIIGRETYTSLPPSFCFPEGWNIPFVPKLVVRDKSKYFNIEKVKGKKVLLLKKIFSIECIKYQFICIYYKLKNKTTNK